MTRTLRVLLAGICALMGTVCFPLTPANAQFCSYSKTSTGYRYPYRFTENGITWRWICLDVNTDGLFAFSTLEGGLGLGKYIDKTSDGAGFAEGKYALPDIDGQLIKIDIVCARRPNDLYGVCGTTGNVLTFWKK